METHRSLGAYGIAFSASSAKSFDQAAFQKDFGSNCYTNWISMRQMEAAASRPPRGLPFWDCTAKE
jgi:hypothetical protein